MGVVRTALVRLVHFGVAASAADVPLTYLVRADQIGRRVPSDFVGFSFEATLIGDDWPEA